MKNCTLLFFTLLFAFSAHAQNFLINENFDSGNDTVPPSGWVNKTLSGDASVDKFQFTSAVFHFAKPLIKNFVVFDAYNGGSPGGTATNGTAEEAILMSPVVSTTSVSNLTLSLDRQVFIQYGQAYIEVSTNGGSSWSTVWSQTTSIVEGTPTNMKLNLDSYKGYSSFRIRFRWLNTSTAAYAGFFALDNVQLYESKSVDVRVSTIVEMYDNSCPSATQSLKVEVYNAGTSTLTKVPVVLKIGSTTLYDTISSISAGATVSTFTGKTFNTSAGGKYLFEAYTNYASDLVPKNDTLRSYRSSSTPPGIPTSGTVTQCGVGSATLTTNRNTGDSTYWFTQATGGTDVGTGNPFVTPYLDKSSTFYVENSRVVQNEITSSAGLYRFNTAPDGPGSMFDVKAKNDILIDSISQHFAYAGTYIMTVYYKSGTYLGSETNTSAWTKLALENDTLVVSGYGKFYTMKLKKPLRIPAGSTYGFYVDAQTTSITFTNGTLNEENADVTITGYTVLSANFNGVTTGYYWNGRLFFRKTCSTGRKAINVNLLPRPKGAKLVEGSTFNGSFRSGTISNFDVASEGRTVGYELEPPTGYVNSDFGTKWAVTAVEMTTVNGTPIPTSDTTMTTPGSKNGTLKYTPSAGWEDSLIILRVKIWEAKYNCDTLLERYIFIVPAPRVKFEAPNVCLGIPTDFTNRSSISSGFNTYRWDFGDGDTSDFESPIHKYNTHGKYQVTLVATSNYGIKTDTTITIEVYEIPDVQFKVKNACEGDALTFTNTTSISSGTLVFNWKFGDGTTSTAKNPTHIYSKPGGYIVSMTASANGCSNDLSKYATQFARPTAAFKSNGGCVGDPVDFTNESTIELAEKTGSEWYFDDGNLGTLTNPAHIYETPGSKMVKLVSISQFGCRDSVTHAVTIKPSPIVSFSYDKSCSSYPVNFTNTTKEPSGETTIYTWSFGDGATSTQKSPSHQYDILGYTKVILKAESTNGCSQILIKDINILVQPVADFEVGGVCSGDPVSFQNNSKIKSGEVEYKWYFGDGDSSSFTSPVKVYDVTSTTIFVIKLEAKAKGGCSDVITKNVTIHEKPRCSFTVVQSKQDRRTFTFVPDDKDYSDGAYTWVLKGSGRYNEKSPTHTFEYFDHPYNIILDITGDNGCACYDSSFTLITSWPLGVENITGSGDINIYPNPSTGKVNITGTLQNTPSEITVFTIDGREAAKLSDVMLSEQATEIDLSHLKEGIYLIEINSGGSRSVQRLILAR
ncbi:MAG: PKD domain-containing protein [Bacteroidetes bacterium]|nr:PKD domain-containing protein [Bacteroidota bacterium]